MSAQTTVTGHDLETMLHIVAKPEDLGSRDPMPLSVMAGLRKLIPCDHVSLTQYDARLREYLLDQDVGDIAEVSDSEEETLEEAFWRHYWHSQACHYPDSTGDLTSITTASDFYSDRELHSTGMYTEYFKPLGLEREMMLCLPSRPGRVLRLVFFRGPGTDFSPRDRGLLTLLRPHLHHTYLQQAHHQPGTPQLTPRQLQLLHLVADGHTNHQIARRLSITEATVRKHLENIFQRLQVTNRTAAVTRALH